MRPLALLLPCLVLLYTNLVGCGSNFSEPTPSPQPTATIVQLEVTRDITQIVQIEKHIIVTATPSPPAPCVPETIYNAEELFIGLLAPLTGNLSAGVYSMIAGANLATEAINQAGGAMGKRVRLLISDTASSPDVGAQRAKELITKQCVAALMGIYESDVGMAVKEVAHQYGIPILFIETYLDKITANQYPEVFRIAPTSSLLAQMAANWLETVGDYNQDGKTCAILIHENSAYGLRSATQAQKWFDEKQIIHQTLSVDLPTTNFSAVLARLVDLDNMPDAIFIRLANDPALQLSQALLNNGFGPQRKTLLILPHVALDSTRFWQAFGERGKGIIVQRIGAWPNTVTEMGQIFAQRYQQLFHHWPDHAAFSAHDALYLIMDAVQRSQTLRGNELIQALETIDLTLASGHYTFPINQVTPPTEQTAAWMWHQWLDPPLLYLQYTEYLQDSAQMKVIWPLRDQSK